MLFGDQQYAHLADELPQYAVDIIVQNPRAIAEWDQITRTMQGAALHRNKNTFREVMKRFGFPLAAIGSLDAVYRIVGLSVQPGEDGPERVAITLTQTTN